MPIDNLINAVIPYTYKVGEKSSGAGLPVKVTLALDPDFKKTLIKGLAIFSISVGVGVAVGVAVAKPKKSR